jgi:hypothetical protein
MGKMIFILIILMKMKTRKEGVFKGFLALCFSSQKM